MVRGEIEPELAVPALLCALLLREGWGEGEIEGAFRHFFFHNLTSENGHSNPSEYYRSKHF
jgi:hypothetical protein